MQSLRNKRKIHNKGFSLVELMVALTIFSMVILVSVGTLLVMVDANAKAQALYSATTNLSFALDSLTREFRTGFHYYCKAQNGNPENNLNNGERRDCSKTEPGDYIAFTRQKDNARVGYRLIDHDGERYIQQSIDYPSPKADVDWSRITSRDVYIDRFDIVIENSTSYTADTDGSDGGQAQPVGTLLVTGNMPNGLETETEFNIQTRIVQRVLDVR